jgi:hypothetical protein
MRQTPLEKSDGFPVLEIDSHYLLMEGGCFVKNILGMIFDFKKLILFNARAQRRRAQYPSAPSSGDNVAWGKFTSSCALMSERRFKGIFIYFSRKAAKIAQECGNSRVLRIRLPF